MSYSFYILVLGGLMKKKVLWYILVVGSCICYFLVDFSSDNEPIRVLVEEDLEYRGMYISYLEYGEFLRGKSDLEMKEEIDYMLERVKSDGFNLVILQVRSFSDAIYESDYFPYSMTLMGEEGITPSFDVLEYFIEKAHSLELLLHAWINPYRVRSNDDISSISEENPAYHWLDTNNVKVLDKGIYYNPASLEVEDLIVKGVLEIIENYDVDGIHFDDYFYPDDTIDLVSYEKYVEDGGTLSLNEFRLYTINRMVKRVYDTIKEYDDSIVFGIAPEGNIDNNYNSNYADTKTWASVCGYVDYLMPQIYYGFENESRPYLETVEIWNEMITCDRVSLLPALAFYKAGNSDKYAFSGIDEWIEEDDIIKRQVIVSKSLSNYLGFVLFRYSFVYNEEEAYRQELDNLLTVFGEK